MKIYRDCNCTNCAYFDNNAPIAIYKGTTTFMTLSVPLQTVIPVPQPDYPCLIPPNICVEEGTYQWDVNLPLTNQDYTVVYQRCCRNQTINNIYNPDGSGATYSVTITPQGRLVSDNSPVFTAFPPTVICAGEPLNFDHSATDVDGDQLVYSFCAPLLGGGIAGGPDDPNGDPTSCNGVMPDPSANACPPPYNPVSFIVPAYSATFPLGGSPAVTINPNTGVITGVPTVQGQFVVGVCVQEYRNGILLSELRRDFQFNVANCTPLVDASIQSDTILSGQKYLIRSCGNKNINFVNQSVQQQNIDVYLWRFFVPGDTIEVNTWNAAVTFPDTGFYYGQLLLNPGTGCADTADIIVQIYPEVNADFSYAYDTCVAGPVDFHDLSSSEGGPIQSWVWNFDDGTSSTEQNPFHLFAFPGIHNVSLTVKDKNGCEADTSKEIVWYPAPPLIIVEPSTFFGCEPATVFFNNLSFPIDSTYDIVWDFGDNTTGSDISPTHIYEQPGIFTVSVSITSPIGCQISATFPDWIKVEPSPIADFTYTPAHLDNFNPSADFTDQSTGAVFWLWNFDDEATSLKQNPSHTFKDTGQQIVTLIVTHPSGCKDTTFQIIDVEPKVTYYLPNAFTPNNDDVNDFFLGNGYLVGLTGFEMSIWNRWGEKIFQTKDPTEGWNGRKNNVGVMSPNGVYVCVVHYTGPRGQKIEIKGFATLIR